MTPKPSTDVDSVDSNPSGPGRGGFNRSYHVLGDLIRLISRTLDDKRHHRKLDVGYQFLIHAGKGKDTVDAYDRIDRMIIHDFL